MASNDWDNSGLPPEKKGLSTWLKVGIGCGVVFLLATATCAGGCYVFTKKIEKDPEGFKQTVFGYVKQYMKDDWEELRAIVDKLGSDEGTRALYRSAAGLGGTYPTEESFLAAAQEWRPLLQPLPTEIPDLEGHDVTYNNNLGRLNLSFRQANGTSIELTWKGGRQKGVPRASQLVELRVKPKK
jgi:hypothetical protein